MISLTKHDISFRIVGNKRYKFHLRSKWVAAEYFGGGITRMDSSRSTHFPASGYANRFDQPLQHRLREGLQPFHQAKSMSISELLQQVEGVSSPQRLNKLVNKLQSKFWNLPKEEQILLRERLADALAIHVLQSSSRPLRLEAAGWLRMFAQAAYFPQPAHIFVTMVTAATQKTTPDRPIDTNERAAYLSMIVDCFWPFRYPFPAYSWEVFPANATFYPLASLLSLHDDYMQDTLMTIFAELPTLDDTEIATPLLPVALQWANHVESERRQRITVVLSRMSHSDAQNALIRLQSDPDQVVRASARRAAESIQKAE